MLGVTAAVADGEIDVVVVVGLGGSGAGDFAGQFFQSQVEDLQVNNERVTHLEFCAGFYLHLAAVEAQAFGVDRLAE